MKNSKPYRHVRHPECVICQMFPSAGYHQCKKNIVHNQKNINDESNILSFSYIPNINNMLDILANLIGLKGFMYFQNYEKKPLQRDGDNYKKSIFKFIEKSYVKNLSEKKIYLANKGECAFFSIGLTTHDEKIIYMLFVKNKIGSRQKWRFSRFECRDSAIVIRSEWVNDTIVHNKNSNNKNQSLDLYSMKSLINNSVEVKQDICPNCDGDGGVRGGCYKCEGSGWVSSVSRMAYMPADSINERAESSRVSNAGNYGLNTDAHYRDRDGRIGSNPEHDDYSEEGEA